MSLHIDHYESAGSGSPLVLIHGWGMHGGMWSSVAEKLAQHFRVMAVDLPGHGWSKAGKGEERREKGSPLLLAGEGLGESVSFPLSSSPFSLDSIVAQLSGQFDETLTVCGWSLGGQVALRWALRHPQQVERLVMVASTPCFVRLEGWRYALSVEILEEFAVNLQHHYALTMKRFLSLQTRGSDQEREVLAILRDGLFSRGEPDMNALQAGLDILRNSDLRGALPDIRQPTLVLAGERDTLIPKQASEYLASRIPSGRLATIGGAAHAPFLSHPETFVELVMEFMRDGNLNPPSVPLVRGKPPPPLTRGGREGFE